MTSLNHARRALIAATILTVAMNAFGQTNLRDLARERAVREPNSTINLPQAPEHPEPKSIEELSRGAAVVVTGKLLRKGSYLSQTEDYVLTDYSISEINVLKGQLPPLRGAVPGTVSSPILSIWGGEVVIDGVRIRAVNQNFRPIEDGGSYLLLLRPARSPGSPGYNLYSAAIFEIESEKVKPLLHRGNEMFPWAADVTLGDLTARVQSAGKPR